VLQLQELRKTYGDTVALDGLSFTVEPGQIFGFVGANGAGKTTAMRIVLGVLEPDAGEVLWRGTPLDADTRRRIGYMPEERGLYPKMRVGDQLAYLATLHGTDDARAAEQAQTWADRLGIGERAGDKVEELSLGNQQRVQLGAAFVHEPDLLVLDEPFSGLDPVGVDVLSEVLRDEVAQRNVSVIFSSHQLELVERLCDAVAIIERGRLVATGGVDELRQRRAGRRWQVEVDGATGSWWTGVPGAEPVESARGVFTLSEDADPQGLLDAARAAGRVVRFGPATPTLAELFRATVAESAEQ
jgi:ABC-2 type transport system ATP-binding protein